jgi:high affinity sulfate transporter 1
MALPEPPRRRFPLGFSFVGYRRRWLRSDTLAGVSVWAVLVPEVLAYATIAGVSPVVGLYAAIPALALYAVFGTSKHLITAPMAATAALSAAAVAQLTMDHPDRFTAVTAELAIACGVLAIVAGLCRLGFVATFISEPVLKGFIIGLALTIIIGQVPRLFGLEKGSGDFFSQLFDFLSHLGSTQWPTLAVGALSLAVIVVLHRFLPHVPSALVAVVLGIEAVRLFNLTHHGVAVVGPIPSGLPVPKAPGGLGLHNYLATAASAVGIVLVGYAESLAAAKNFAVADQAKVDPNRELIALGAANLGAGFFQGMFVNGSLSKTAVNVSARARTQLSSLVAAVLTILTLLFLTGFFADLPEATLAAIVIAALVELIDVGAMKRLFRLATSRQRRAYGLAARPDFIAAMAALLGVLIFGTLPGLFIGIAMSLLLLIFRTSRPAMAELGRVPGPSGLYAELEGHPENATVPGVAIVRVEGQLFFGNADTVEATLLERARRPGTRAVVVDAQSVPYVDISAVDMLQRLAAELESRGVALRIAQDVAIVRDLFDAAGADPLLQSVYPTIPAAIEALGDR